MKTWILKSDLSRSPQAAFRMYACGTKKSKHVVSIADAGDLQSLLARKIRSRFKLLLKRLTQKYPAAPLILRN